MNKTLNLIALIFLCINIPSYAKDIKSNKVCLLYYERLEHPFYKKINDEIKNNPNVIFISAAKPIDIVNCVKTHNPREIIVIAHAFETEDKNLYLGFYTPTSKDVMKQKIENQFKEIIKFENQVEIDKVKSNCMNSKYWPDSPTNCQTYDDYLKQTLHLKSILKNPLGNQQIIQLLFGYDKGLFFDRPFLLLEQTIASLKTEKNLNLQKIRLMSCEPDKIFATYPSFKKIINEHNIILDISKKSTIMSVLKGKHVSSLDMDWLIQSFK